MRQVLVLGTLLALSAPAFAQEVNQSAKYGTEPDCGFGDGGGLVLDFATGIQGYEYYCTFFEVKKAEGSTFLLVEAVCEEPGLRNPDLFSITTYDDSSIEVVSLYDSVMFPATEENPDPGTNVYKRCD